MLRVWIFALAALVGMPGEDGIWPFNGGEKMFMPAHRLTGMGASRRELDELTLDKRTELMIQSQQFGILRDPRALAGAQRITSPRMQKMFQDAARKTGTPASLVAAVAYLESWGDSQAQSPTGPKGVMQIAAGTARGMGLKLIYATRYKTVAEKVTTKNKRGKMRTKSVKRRSPYTVLVRDERMTPERAIPAAAAYLNRLTNKYGGQDWAVFAYHCGEGCVGSMRELSERASGVQGPDTVARMFFGGDPSHNRELYQAVQREMDRDFSPTYWFRIKCSEQLLDLYKRDPAAFRKLVEQYRYEPDPNQRAPHRLSVWLKSADLEFATCEDIRRDQGKRLVRVFEDEDFYGFRLRKDLIGAADPGNLEYFLQASPAAVGTLAYIAFETRRLHAAMRPKGEKFQPIEVTSLVQPVDFAKRTPRGGRDESLWHCTGQVFDVDLRSLPVGEREALEFVLSDMGWMGYLGFVEESGGVLHVGSSPSSREFFTQVFQEALAASKKSS
jgi:Transglycosylase SLT domain